MTCILQKVVSISIKRAGLTASEENIVTENINMLLSDFFSEVADRESIGGNAGINCLAVNSRISPLGKILCFGNFQDLGKGFWSTVLRRKKVSGICTWVVDVRTRKIIEFKFERTQQYKINLILESTMQHYNCFA